MQVKIQNRFIRSSPRKMRLVADRVRRKSVPMAYSILDRMIKRASVPVKKCIQQAVDAAVKNHQAVTENLVVTQIYVDGAGMMKRFRAMSMGRAGMIRKRFSHLTVEVSDVVKGKRPATGPLKATQSTQHKTEIPVRTRKEKKKLAGAAA